MVSRAPLFLVLDHLDVHKLTLIITSLTALGAPPRLKMHISGESLLNDGSAVVFYTIFSQRFFYELGIKKFGSDIGWNDGFGWFFRLCVSKELFCRFFDHQMYNTNTFLMLIFSMRSSYSLGVLRLVWHSGWVQSCY